MQFSLLFVFLALTSLVAGAFFTDIMRGIGQSGRFDNFLKDIPDNFLQDLENNEQVAGNFVCNILAGNPTGALGGLAGDIGDEASSDFSAVTSFIGGLPTLVPAVLSDIEQGGSEVVSVIDELVTNPGAAITVIVSGVESVVGDIGSVIGDGISDIASIFNCLDGCSSGNSSSSATTTLSGAAGMLQSMCKNIQTSTGSQPAMTVSGLAGPTAGIASPSPTFSQGGGLPASTSSLTGSNSTVVSPSLPLSSSTSTTSSAPSSTSTSQASRGWSKQFGFLHAGAGSLACVLLLTILL